MKNQETERANTQKGSILVWILIAIVLFAALSFAMTQSFRGGASTATDQRSKLTASEIIEYGNKVRDTVRQVMIANGCTAYQLGFDNDVWRTHDGTPLHDSTHNPNVLSDSCRIFNLKGGGLNAVTFPSNGITLTAPTNTRSGHSLTMSGHVAGVGTADEELILQTFYISKDVCIQINNLLGVNNPGGMPPKDDPGAITRYNGTFPGTSGTAGDSAPELAGKYAFCAEYLSDALYPGYNFHFYQVLVAR